MYKIVIMCMVSMIFLSFSVGLPIDNTTAYVESNVPHGYDDTLTKIVVLEDNDCKYHEIEVLEDEVIPYPIEDVVLEDLPDSWDWRDAEVEGVQGNYVTSVKDQGTCGSCWAFAPCAALESRIRIVRKDPSYDVDLSEQYLVSCCPSPMCEQCERGAAFYAFAYMFSFGGALPENCFFYSCSDYDKVSNPFVPPCTGKCPHWQDLLIPIKSPMYLIGRSIDDIKSKLIMIGPLVSGFTVYDSFIDYSGGIYDHPDDDPDDPIMHEVVIVGYKDMSTEEDPDYGYWICKNSNGTAWGENGYFRIVYGDCRIGDYICYSNYVKSHGKDKTIFENRIPLRFFLRFSLRDIIDLILCRECSPLSLFN